MAYRPGRDKLAVNAEQIAARLLEAVQEVATEVRPRKGPVRPITLDSSLERDLGLDSLGRVELIARLERKFNAALPEHVFASAETPRDLLRALSAARAPRAMGIAAPAGEITLGEAEEAPRSVQTLVDVLDWHVSRHPDRPHVRLLRHGEEDEAITYGRLRHGAETVAAGLQQRGLQPGEPVAIMLPTSRDYFFSFYGILLAGGVPVPLYPPARPGQIEDHLRRHAAILSNCLAVTLVTVPEAKRVAQLLKSQVESLRHVVPVEELTLARTALTRPVIGAGDIALLQYTSGSTGTPKGVVLTHANLLANIRGMGEVVQADPTDVFVSWLPLYHDMGLIGAWLGSLYFAVHAIVMSPLAFLAMPQRWLWALHHYRATLTAGPNFAYGLCLRKVQDEDVQGLDLSSVRIAFNGAEQISPETMERFCERFKPYGFRREAMTPVYGLAESTLGVTFPALYRGPSIDRVRREALVKHGVAKPADAADRTALRFVACGQPLPGHQIRVVDATGQELPERHEGALQFCGPSATSGYYRNAEATKRLFRGQWLDSGDLAYIAEGEVYITGRTKDLIVRAGRNIYPEELEEAIGDIPEIRKGCVAAFGSRDPRTETERLIVLAETRAQEPEALEKLRTQINAVTADLIGSTPDDVVLAPPHTVLKTSSGKIRRTASRELYDRGRIGAAQRAVRWQMIRLALAALAPEFRRARRVVSAMLYAAYALVVFSVMAPLVWTTVVLLPRRSWRWSFMRAVANRLAWITGTKLTIQGLEHLPPPETPCVFVANHASYLDGYVLIAALRRAFSFVAKAELQRHPIAGVFLRRLDAEFVERFDLQKGVADARRISRAVAEGRSLLFFPEGTFTRFPGLLPFYMGAFIAAAETNVPVVPVAIRGTRSILRAENWFPRRGAIVVTIGAPIDPAEIRTRQMDTWTVALILRDAARQQILRHCGEPDLAAHRPAC